MGNLLTRTVVKGERIMNYEYKESDELTSQLIKLTENRQQLNHLLNILENNKVNENFMSQLIDKLLDRIQGK